MKVLAWVMIAVISPLPQFLLYSYLGNIPDPLVIAGLQVVTVVVLIAITLVRPHLRPVRGFLLVGLAWAVGYLGVTFAEHTAWWLAFRSNASNPSWVLADSLLQGIPTVAMVGIGMAQYRGWRELFLDRGNLSAPASFVRLPNRAWRTLIAPVAISFMLVTGSFLLFRLRGQAVHIDRLAAALPIVLLFPIVNAINEEVRFRNVFFAAGTSLFSRQSLLQLTTALFGLAHVGSFLGTSGTGGSLAAGLAYAVGAAALGWINGTATLDTEGIATAWIIHGASDLVIIVGYALF